MRLPWVILIPLAWIVALVGVRVGETRLWRDASLSTPFYGVSVGAVEAYGRGVAVSGIMYKRRCSRIVPLMAYTVAADGISRRAFINTDPEGIAHGDRPPSPDAQYWGPWVITPASVDPDPVRWSIYVAHQCTEGKQVNLFAAGNWIEG